MPCRFLASLWHDSSVMVIFIAVLLVAEVRVSNYDPSKTGEAKES